MKKKLEDVLYNFIDPPSFSKSAIHGEEKSKPLKISLKPEYKFINIGNNMLPLIFYEATKNNSEDLKHILESLNCEEGKEINPSIKYDLNNLNIVKNTNNKVFNDFNNIEHLVEFLDGIEPIAIDELKIQILNKSKIIESFNIVSPDWRHYFNMRQGLFLDKINPKISAMFDRQEVSFEDAVLTIRPETERWVKSFFSGYPDFSTEKQSKPITAIIFDEEDLGR